MTEQEVLDAIPYNYDYFKKLAGFYADRAGVDPFTVDFSGTPTTGPQALVVQFTSAVTGGAGGYQYRWDFGDGGTSEEANPSYEYPNQGNWTVSLTVTDAVGIQNGEAKVGYITVTAAP